jgi:ribosomal-protein-alanine N-acetyltransferase
MALKHLITESCSPGRPVLNARDAARVRELPPAVGNNRWRRGLPPLLSRRLVIREVRVGDAADLAEMFADPDVSTYLAPCPPRAEAFREFVAWARQERQAGRYICFVARDRRTDALVGTFQIWRLEPSFETAEWGFGIARAYWGRGYFAETANVVLGFAIRTLGVGRLEARVAAENTHAAAALARLGATAEGLLRRCFRTNGALLDYVMWTIFADEWTERRT